MKKILFLTLLFLVFLPNSVKGECSDSEEIRLQKLARNINASYVYNESNDTFTLTLTNLTSDITILEIDNMRKFKTTGDLTFKNLLSGKHTYIMYPSNTECGAEELTTKYVMLPYYNQFYNSDECKGIKNYSYCNKWLNNSMSYDIWHKKVTEYKVKHQEEKKETRKTNSILSTLFEKGKDIYGKYYYIILPLIIISLATIIIVKNKKDSLI